LGQRRQIAAKTIGADPLGFDADIALDFIFGLDKDNAFFAADPTLRLERNPETHQTVLWCMGEAHADVVLVNPLKDGLNLVALEAAAINARDGIVICSRDAGAFDVLEAGVLGINPFDIEGTADAIATAVTMASDARHKLAATARQIATSASPTTWLRDCLAAARR
jgi:trehalose-6-phosphate synthase